MLILSNVIKPQNYGNSYASKKTSHLRYPSFTESTPDSNFVPVLPISLTDNPVALETSITAENYVNVPLSDHHSNMASTSNSQELEIIPSSRGADVLTGSTNNNNTVVNINMNQPILNSNKDVVFKLKIHETAGLNKDGKIHLIKLTLPKANLLNAVKKAIFTKVKINLIKYHYDLSYIDAVGDLISIDRDEDLDTIFNSDNMHRNQHHNNNNSNGITTVNTTSSSYGGDPVVVNRQMTLVMEIRPRPSLRKLFDSVLEKSGRYSTGGGSSEAVLAVVGVGMVISILSAVAMGRSSATRAPGR
ncbi:unnamed protein product [Ambrosiozyma monospora]|uniref:Unnamed protein product n=1 Tax=Ambrosiozyma monospora TaxID=43982 RepID=A0ACB5T2J0_AMBMO|nr:unnamed protein product [Ambrosiozyma monospora]